MPRGGQGVWGVESDVESFRVVRSREVVTAFRFHWQLERYGWRVEFNWVHLLSTIQVLELSRRALFSLLQPLFAVDFYAC